MAIVAATALARAEGSCDVVAQGALHSDVRSRVHLQPVLCTLIGAGHACSVGWHITSRFDRCEPGLDLQWADAGIGRQSGTEHPFHTA